MSYNGSGVFNINTTGQPVVTGTVISSSTFNALTADLATGLSTAITKDGQTTVTANIPFNSYKITGLAAGTAATDAARLGQVQAGTAALVTVTGTDTYTGTMSPVLTAYAAGNVFTFVVPNTNTSSCTINIDSLGAKAITRNGSTALVAGDLVANSVVSMVYDGTRFQVLNSSSVTNLNVSGNMVVAGSITASGGTANGVAYLNGSKVVTSGSALTFDGTEILKNSGGAIQYNDVRGSAAAGTRLSAGGTLGADSFDLFQNSSAGYVFNRANTSIIFGVNNSEQMRLTSTGLGIGTSSPAAKLDIALTGTASLASATITKTTDFSSSARAGFGGLASPNDGIYFGMGANGTGIAAGFGLFREASGWNTALAFYTNNITAGPDGTAAIQEKMRIDSSGNVGIGVTPSAWPTAGNIDISGGNIFSTGGTTLGSNAYYSGGWKYKNSAAATYYAQVAGAYHAWFTAASGTAGNAISFTQAMTLDASGNLLVGTTSTGTSNSTNITLEKANGYVVVNHVNGTASGAGYVVFGYNGSLIGSITQNGTTAVAYNTSSDYRLKNITGPVTNSGAYIDSLKPVEGTWKADGSTFVGLIAHEVQEASRTVVATGEKDGEEMQGMDYSSAEIIANLIAEIQSLRQRLTALESK